MGIQPYCFGFLDGYWVRLSHDWIESYWSYWAEFDEIDTRKGKIWNTK